MTLSGATNATVSATSGTGTITDDDEAPTVSLALSRTSITESGATNATTVTASLDHASSEGHHDHGVGGGGDERGLE